MASSKSVSVVSSFVATGNGGEAALRGRGAAWLEGTFEGTCVLERLVGGRSEWVPVLADGYGTAVVLTAPGVVGLDEPAEDVRYRWRCSVYGSGTVVAGLQQG